MIRTVIKLIVIALLSLVLVGCEQHVLYSELTESEANEMVARLYSSNVSADKIAESDGSFRVDTDKSSFAEAVAVLQAHGLPRERFQSLGDIFEKDASSASVFVKHRAAIDLGDSVGKIKSMVVTGFENLPYENVTVSLFPAESPNMSTPNSNGVVMDTFSASVSTKPSATSNFIIILCFFVGLFLLVLGGISLYKTRAPAVPKGRRRRV